MATAPWHYPFKKAFRIGCFLASHLIAVCILIGVIGVISRVLEEDGNPKLFGLMPLRYLFEAMDVVIVLVFGVSVIVDAWRICKEKHDD